MAILCCQCKNAGVYKKPKLKNCTKSLIAFSLQKGGAKKEAEATLRSAAFASKSAKRNAEGKTSRSAEREEGFAPPLRRLLKKAGENFFKLTKTVSFICNQNMGVSNAMMHLRHPC